MELIFNKVNWVVAVEGPSESEPTEHFDADSYKLPEPLGYSPSRGAVAWSLALFAERRVTARRPIGTHPIYPHPWYTIWRTPLDLLITARNRLGNPEVGAEPGLRPQIDEAVELILADIARRAYEAYLVYQQSIEIDAGDEIRRTARRGEVRPGPGAATPYHCGQAQQAACLSRRGQTRPPIDPATTEDPAPFVVAGSSCFRQD